MKNLFITDEEAIDFLKNLKFAKGCDYDMFFLYRITQETYYIRCGFKTRKHISEDECGNLIHTFLKDNKKSLSYTKKEIFKEYCIGIDSDIHEYLRKCNAKLIKENENCFKIKRFKAEKFRVNLIGLEFADLIMYYAALQKPMDLYDVPFMIPTKRIIIDKLWEEQLKQIKLDIVEE